MFTSPSIAWRGKLAQALAQVHQHHDKTRDVRGRISCPHCRSPLQFTVLTNGLSRGHCTAGCGIRWVQ